MEIKDWISIVAITISIISFWQSLRKAKSEIKPVLVFIYEGETGWSLKNVGGGPALNIIVAQKDVSREKWFDPVRVPPIAE